MHRNLVRTSNEALLYLTDCLLATVSDMAMKKSKKKHEYSRHIEIAQTAINWIKDFGLLIDTNSRVYDVLATKSQTVKEWAIQFEPSPESSTTGT